jgi:hypothetical protein
MGIFFASIDNGIAVDSRKVYNRIGSRGGCLPAKDADARKILTVKEV